MGYRRKIAGAAIAAALVFAVSSSALAEDTVTDAPVTDRAVTDRPTDSVTDKPTDKAVDAPTDKVTDRPTDRVTDHCRMHSHGDLGRHCIDDRHPHDFNIRALINRLIHAGEWEKLVRLLHWLGWI